jgi:hypothetical protein
VQQLLSTALGEACKPAYALPRRARYIDAPTFGADEAFPPYRNEVIVEALPQEVPLLGMSHEAGENGGPAEEGSLFPVMLNSLV